MNEASELILDVWSMDEASELILDDRFNWILMSSLTIKLSLDFVSSLMEPVMNCEQNNCWSSDHWSLHVWVNKYTIAPSWNLCMITACKYIAWMDYNNLTWLSTEASASASLAFFSASSALVPKTNLIQWSLTPWQFLQSKVEHPNGLQQSHMVINWCDSWLSTRTGAGRLLELSLKILAMTAGGTGFCSVGSTWSHNTQYTINNTVRAHVPRMDWSWHRTFITGSFQKLINEWHRRIAEVRIPRTRSLTDH